jgi:hypothetical protein
MRRLLVAVVILSVSASVFGIVIYSRTIQKQNEAAAFLRALSDVRFGHTTRDDFAKTMIRFKKYESSRASSVCSDGKCYEGVGYGLDNSAIGRYSLFPNTNLAAGVYFDSDNFVQGLIVTLDRTDTASVTVEEQPGTVGESARQFQFREGNAKQFHLVISQDNRDRLTQLSTPCFTSFVGCDTAQKLLFNVD